MTPKLTTCAAVGLMVLSWGCNQDAQLRDQQTATERRWAAVWEQEQDIKRCRDRGGIPVTKLSDLVWNVEARMQLVRCEFPCDVRLLQQAEKQ